MATQQQQQQLIAIINACGNAITTITNYSMTISDPKEISACISASQELHSVSSEATQALQALDDAAYKQEVVNLKNAANQMQTQIQRLKQVIQVTGVVLQIASAVLQVVGLIAAL